MCDLFTNAAENDVQRLPETLEEITLENINRLEPLITIELTGVFDLAWSSDGAFLAVSVSEGVWIYAIQGKEIESHFIKTDELAYSITFIPQSFEFILGDYIYDADTLDVLKIAPEAVDYLSQDGTLYATRNASSITISDFETNEVIHNVPLSIHSCDYGCGLLDVAFSPDDEYLAFSSQDELSDSGIIEVATGEKTLFPLQLAWSMNYSPDGSMIAFSDAQMGYDGRRGIQIINSMTGEKIGFGRVPGANNSPVFSRDGRLVVVGGTNYTAPNMNNAYGTLYFFSIDQFIENKELEPQDAIRSEISDGWVNGVAFSPDYHLLATGDANIHHPDGELIIWGVPTE